MYRAMRTELRKVAGIPLVGAGIGAGVGGLAGYLHERGNVPEQVEGASPPLEKTWRDYAAPVAMGATGGALIGGGAELGLRHLMGRGGAETVGPFVEPPPTPLLGHGPEDVEAATRRVSAQQNDIRNVVNRAKVHHDPTPGSSEGFGGPPGGFGGPPSVNPPKPGDLPHSTRRRDAAAGAPHPMTPGGSFGPPPHPADEVRFKELLKNVATMTDDDFKELQEISARLSNTSKRQV